MVIKGQLRKKIFEAVQEEWPVHISGICRKLAIKESLSNISKVRYHINILKEDSLVRTKKIDRALVVWPVEMERLRVVHDFIKDIK